MCRLPFYSTLYMRTLTIPWHEDVQLEHTPLTHDHSCSLIYAMSGPILQPFQALLFNRRLKIYTAPSNETECYM